MKTLNKILFLTAGLTGLSALGAAQPAAPATGHWEGTIKMEHMDLGIAVDLAPNPAGTWTGTISVAGSSTRDVPLGDLAVAGKSVRFTARLPGPATFEGSVSEDATTLAGTATNAQGDTTFELKRTGEASVKLPPPSSPLAKAFAGRWSGTMSAGEKTQRIALVMSAAPDGLARATLIAVDHDNLELPVTTVTIDGRQLRLEVRALTGAYRGMLGDNGEIAGEWTEGGKTRTLNFKPVPAETTTP